MKVMNILNNLGFVFLRWEYIVSGSMVVNFTTQILKKIFKNWFGSLIAIFSSVVVSSIITVYYLLYKIDMAVLRTSPTSYTLKIIFEYIILTISIIITCKMSYDTLKCYLEKIIDIFKNDKTI